MKQLRRVPELGVVVLLTLLVLAGFWAGDRLPAAQPPPTAEPSPVKVAHEETPPFVTQASPIRDVVLLMLRSGERWRGITFAGTSAYVRYPDQAIRTWEVEGTIEQDSKTGPYRFSLTTRDQKDGEVVYRSVSDGKTEWGAQPRVKYYTKEPLGLGLLPPSDLPAVNDENHPFIPHPMSGKIGSPFAETIFPQGFAQQLAVDLPSDKLRLLGTEQVAGRDAVILQYDMDANSRFVIWVDGTTGILLKLQFYDIHGLKSGHWDREVEITTLQYDQQNQQGIFTFDPAGFREVGHREMDKAWTELMTGQ